MRTVMQQSNTTNQIGALLLMTIALTIGISYIPSELGIVRQILSMAQLGLMVIIMTVTVRAVLRDF